MVPAGNEAPHSPSDPSIYPDVNHGRSHVPVQAERGREVRRHRDGVTVDEGGPDRDFLVGLVGGREEGGEGDLLAAVGGVDAEAVVVDADAAVGVVGGDGQLNAGSEDGGGDSGGEIKGVDGGVLEDEVGFGRAEDGPGEDDHQEDQDCDADYGGEEELLA